ncbi:hypothetical protein ACBJ59_29210 [Nonomuraea sp. MTCD27]|uniref:hypothetical protein n=1 Tax=Nonomuraea sp. MTCD27 TaxID=1676747 RepID=UPI0035C09ED7
MNFCLSDLVPPLRWSDASTITLLTGQPDLPDAWWRSLPMPLVLTAIGPESLGELLTEIALEHWPAAAVGDVLPALHVLDPDEADEPAVAIALDRAGSWAGLLALTSRELVDQPFIQARPVLNTLFSAVLVRLAHSHEHPHAHARPHVATPVPVTPEAAAPAVVREAEAPAVAPAPLAHEPFAHERAVEEQAVHEREPQEYPAQEPSAHESLAHEPLDEEPVAHEASAHEGPAEEPAAEEPLAQEAPAEEAPAEEAEPVAAAPEHGAAGQEPAFESFAVQHAAEAPEERDTAPEGEPDEVAAAHEDVPAHGDVPAHEETPSGEDAAPHGEVPEGAERVVDADAEPTADEAPEPEPEPVLDAADEPAPEPAAQEAAELQEAALQESAPQEAAFQEAAFQEAEDADEAAEREPDHDEQEQELPELIEAAFAGLDDKSWAVAQNRVFTDEPSAVDQLAKLFAVPPAEIAATENELRTRLDHWLASEEAAPYRAHLDELVRTLGPTAPKEQLIGAAAWHNVEIRALEVPAWQFVLATLAPSPPPVQLPPVQLPPQPQPQPPVELVQSAFGPVQLPPPPPPGPPQFQAFTPVAPPVGETNGGAHEPEQPYQPLKDVSQTRRCFRQPDGRWWLRIDVTAEQLAGGECALPTGFASYLGLSPGESRTVRSAAGELTMTWHGRPVLESIERLLMDVGAREGGHLFLTLSDEGVLRARHLPVAAQGAEKITKALRLVGYTAPGGTRDQAARVIATRIGMTGPVALPELLDRLRERGDRDLLELLD